MVPVQVLGKPGNQETLRPGEHLTTAHQGTRSREVDEPDYDFKNYFNGAVVLSWGFRGV